MSIEATCKTQIKDRTTLVEVLREIYGKNAISISEEGQKVRGYSSSRLANVLIKIPHMYGTAGYCKASDGTWELVYDSTDKTRLQKIIPQKTKSGTQDYLAQIYAKHQVKKLTKSLSGHLVQDQVDSDGSIRMKIKVASY